MMLSIIYIQGLYVSVLYILVAQLSIPRIHDIRNRSIDAVAIHVENMTQSCLKARIAVCACRRSAMNSQSLYQYWVSKAILTGRLLVSSGKWATASRSRHCSHPSLSVASTDLFAAILPTACPATYDAYRTGDLQGSKRGRASRHHISPTSNHSTNFDSLCPIIHQHLHAQTDAVVSPCNDACR